MRDFLPSRDSESDAGDAIERVRVDDIGGALQKLREEIEGEEIAAPGDKFIPLPLSDARHRREGMITAHFDTHIADGIAITQGCAVRGVDRGGDAMSLQTLDETQNSRLSAAPLNRLVFAEDVGDVHEC